MLFIDQVKIFVKGGDGGNGCVAFRREAYVPRGGPSGGDGGNGGDVIVKASPHLSTLLDLRYQQQYTAQRGGHGQGKDCHGKSSPDIIISVPIGTLVREAESLEILADLVEEGQTITVARGGRGGKGNARFATPTRQAPTFAEEGKKGEESWLQLELKLLADVGLVGLPNAGKSTLISAMSSARPKIADYPFTTLTPHLGVVEVEGHPSFVVADIPGLIEGAHTGKGLGFQFLRHIERCRFVLHLIDAADSTPGDPVKEFETIRGELGCYSPDLLIKPFAIAATKIDIKEDGKRLKEITDYCKQKDYPLYPVSSVTGEGLKTVLGFLAQQIERAKKSAASHAKTASQTD
jgi:GTP-binding protein